MEFKTLQTISPTHATSLTLQLFYHTILSPNNSKEQGNEFYKQKNYVKAIEAYSAAVDLATAQGNPVPTYYLNRARSPSLLNYLA